MFIDRPDPAIRILVAQYREQHPSVTYLEVIQFARAEGDALRAHNPDTWQKANRALMLETGFSLLSIGASNNPITDYDNFQAIHQDVVSIPTTELQSTKEVTFETALAEMQVEPARYANSIWMAASKIPFLNGLTLGQLPVMVNNRIPGRVSNN